MSNILYNLKEKTKSILEKETGTVIKSHTEKIRIALAYPNVYKIGMSNLGFQKVYSIINNNDRFLCERVFLPDNNDIDSFKKNNIPLFTIESQTPVEQFDIVAFSVTFELDYVNILNILALSHIPLHSKDRENDYPLVVAGGICITCNPEPIANFIDAAFIGEGENTLKEFMPEYEKGLNTSENKQDMLMRLKNIESIYIPSKQPKNITKRSIFNKLDTSPTASSIITKDTVFSNMFLLEVERGCPMGCHFCVAGHLYKPSRTYELATLVDQIKKGMEVTKKIGLIGMSISHYAELDALAEFCLNEELKISVSSLRIDKASDTLLNLLAKSGLKTITFAPEAGTERLRKSLNKNISNMQIYESIEKSLGYNIPNIKLYFLIGLPSETDVDIVAITEMVKKIKSIMLNIAIKKKKIGTITVSINQFIPKPGTPYQCKPMENIKSVEAKIKTIKKSLKKVGNIKVISDSPRSALIQGILSMGDRKTGELVLKAYELNGDWKKAFSS